MASSVASSVATTTMLTKAQHQSPDISVSAVASASASHQQQQLRPYSTTATTMTIQQQGGGEIQQIPIRFTKAFAQMEEVCPNHISLYASCVMARNNPNIKNSCNEEFRKVKECFRKVRGF